MKAIIYTTTAKDRRIKLRIPYQATTWRARIKEMNTSFYHPNQKLWSIANTQQNQDILRDYLGDHAEYQQQVTTVKIPTKQLNNHSTQILDRYIQHLTLRGYSQHTLQS